MKLLFFGDLVLDREIKYSQDFLNIVSQYDHCIVNLEAPFIGNGKPIRKAGRWINSEERYISSLKCVFDCVTLANNHTMDYGENSLSHTLNILDANQLKYCGAGSDRKKAHEPIALGDCFIFSVAENEFGCSSETFSGIACFDDLLVLHDNIKKYSKLGKVIICYHGGTEIIPIPPKYLRDRFSLLKSFGADVIIGHHPHVVQGFEKNIFYSLGNFYFINQNTTGYQNIDWSLVVGYDSDKNEIKTYHVSSIDDTIVVVDKLEEMQFLNEILHSEDYKSLDSIISLLLYKNWYKEYFSRNITPEILLHYFRCDSHKQNIVNFLSHDIGEYRIDKLKKYSIEIDNIDHIMIKRL